MIHVFPIFLAGPHCVLKVNALLLIEKEDFFQNGLFSYKYGLRSKINLKSAKFCVRSDLRNFSLTLSVPKSTFVDIWSSVLLVTSSIFTSVNFSDKQLTKRG